MNIMTGMGLGTPGVPIDPELAKAALLLSVADPLGVVADVRGGGARVMIDIEAMEGLSPSVKTPSVAMAGQVGSQRASMRVGTPMDSSAAVRNLSIDARTGPSCHGRGRFSGRRR